jgi:hypothetical protein
MNQIVDIDKKKLKKYLKNKDVVFCMITYPSIFLIYIFLLLYIKLSDMAVISPRYTFFSFLILSFLSILSIVERIDTKFSHKVQGDKLKLKRVDNTWKR